MKNLPKYFYKNQNIIVETPVKNFRGYINKIEDGFLYIILYASFDDRQSFQFNSEGYDLNADAAFLSESRELTLIIPEDFHTLVFKSLPEAVFSNAGGISLSARIDGEPEERQGREFLRVKAPIQLIYEEISMEEFLDTKDGYISRPSFTTSVYGIYNIAAPRFYQQASGETDADAPVNPRMERLLIAINSKLDVILSLLNPDISIFANVKERPVSISGAGIMWHETDGSETSSPGAALSRGGILKITMLFPNVPQFLVKALAQVVRISGGEDGVKKSIACKFIAINESDRDEIIKFTMEKQRQQIKKSAL